MIEYLTSHIFTMPLHAATLTDAFASLVKGGGSAFCK